MADTDLYEQLMYRCAKPSRTDGKRTLVTDGDPLLLEVFELLGWTDPYAVPDDVPEGGAPEWWPALIIHRYRQAQEDKPPDLGDIKPPEGGLGDGDKPPEGEIPSQPRPRRPRGPWIPIEEPEPERPGADVAGDNEPGRGQELGLG